MNSNYRKITISTLLVTAVAATSFQSASATSDELAPPDWSRQTDGKMTRYSAPNNQEWVIVRDVQGVAQPLVGARTIMRGIGGQPNNCTLQESGLIAQCDDTLTKSGIEMRVRVYAIKETNGLTTVMHMAKSDVAGLESRFEESGDRIMRYLAVEPTPAIQPPTTPKSASEPLDLERVLFDLSYSYGIGGAFYPKYTPVYLFKSGDACRCADIAAADVDIVSLKNTRPEDIGTWRKKGQKYSVHYPDGEADDLDPKVGPPQALPSGRLNGRYQSLGGGGNTALGGSTIVIASKDYDFRFNGTFYQESFGGGGNRSVTATSKRGAIGQWQVDGATLELTYPDGRKVRTSIYWDTKADIVNGSPDVIWIGGKAYTLKD